MTAAQLLKLVVSVLKALLLFIHDNQHAHELTDEARRKNDNEFPPKS